MFFMALFLAIRFRSCGVGIVELLLSQSEMSMYAHGDPTSSNPWQRAMMELPVI